MLYIHSLSTKQDAIVNTALHTTMLLTHVICGWLGVLVIVIYYLVTVSGIYYHGPECLRPQHCDVHGTVLRL